MKKEIYESPEMEIVEFDMPDVITTSGYCDKAYQKQLEGYPTNCASGYYYYLNPDGECANFFAFDTSVPCEMGTLEMSTT